MTPATILIIDDDDELRAELADQLSAHENFEVAEAASGKAGLERAGAKGVGLILLDVGLPDIDGREVCRKLREAGVQVPVIMLTGAASENDTVTGLDAGANDYVTKPFAFGVLLARIRAQLRQHEQSEFATFALGPFVFYPASKLLVHNQTGRKTRLTDKETRILKHLLRAGGKPVARGELLDRVWGYNAGVTTHTLETHIYRLRQKIEDEPANAVLLVTESGGYRLNL